MAMWRAFLQSDNGRVNVLRPAMARFVEIGRPHFQGRVCPWEVGLVGCMPQFNCDIYGEVCCLWELAMDEESQLRVDCGILVNGEVAWRITGDLKVAVSYLEFQSKSLISILSTICFALSTDLHPRVEGVISSGCQARLTWTALISGQIFRSDSLIPCKTRSVILELQLRRHALNLFDKKKMMPQLKKAVTDNPKKVADLIDLVNLPIILRDFMGQSQSSQLNCFRRVWSYIKDNNLQDPLNNNFVNCDPKLKSILLGKSKVDLTELPMLIKLHFPKKNK
ncbi:upstream activation factor subunit uaf30 [Phtheirospermum japonicum]|uniref:Upstream activation factor subunit uaf30 n=1 Tax=Phtheirospermum japonicum TaxID=374723 RepID=A0A830BKJ2_9LAMI|nr:upstream activation factor subunit uaf30 [Phtheirospermum japonicum]